ncbi:hypothetical protein SLA2020_426090 [Shorea laevis]
MGIKSFLVGLAPFAAMVSLECLEVVLNTLNKAATSKGTSSFVLVVYGNALGSLILLPIAFFLNWTKRPPINFSVLCKFFLLSFVGTTVMQNCMSTGVRYSSPTLASAILNLIPVFTFLLAVIFRMEKIDLRNSKSQIKILGTLVSISGAIIVTLFKGPSIVGPVAQSQPQPSPSTMLTTTNSWVIGGLFLAAAGLCIAISIIAQAAILKGYPSKITLVFFYSFFGTIQSAIVAFIAERNPNAWKLTHDIDLIFVVYAAFIGSVVTVGVSAWCIHRKGPVFVAMFKPLGIAIAAYMGFIFLGDTLYLGSIIGAVIIVAGFYGVLWAKSKEKEDEVGSPHHKLESSSVKTPLLHSHLDA